MTGRRHSGSARNLPQTAGLIWTLRKVAQKRPDSCALTLQELGSLVIQVGGEAGFVVQVEVPVPRRARCKVDCAWLAINRRTEELIPIVAWEFDGRDVGIGHVAGDKKRLGNIWKLRTLRPLLMIQALYSFRSAPLPCAKDLTLNELTEKGVMIVHDAELLNGAVFAITSLALKGAATLGLSVIEGFRCEVPLTRADISGAR